jgi:hypothetical protein
MSSTGWVKILPDVTKKGLGAGRSSEVVGCEENLRSSKAKNNDGLEVAADGFSSAITVFVVSRDFISLRYFFVRDSEQALSGTLEESSVTPSSLVDASEWFDEVSASRATESEREDTVADSLCVS